jgi:hypothetical protein
MLFNPNNQMVHMKRLSILLAVLMSANLGYSQTLPANAKQGWTEKIRQEQIDDYIKNAVESYKKTP